MSTLAAKITAPPIDLSTVIFEDEEDEYKVPSPILKSSCALPSAREALPLIDLSSVIFDDDEEEYHYVSPPPPLTPSTSPCSTPSPPIPTSPTSSYSTLSSSAADDSTHSPPPTKQKTRKFLEPTDRSMDFLWPEGIRPEYLRGPPHHQEVTVEENNSGIININGPLGQVVPFMPRKSKWAPKKPSPLRAVWTVEVEEEEEIPLVPLEKEIDNGAEPVDYWFL